MAGGIDRPVVAENPLYPPGKKQLTRIAPPAELMGRRQ